MKKQFFYAALAIGMMSSCSSNDLPGNQQPENPMTNEDKVAIELGIASPNFNIEATTRGAGAVGSSEDDNNKWKGEQLYISMFDSENHLVTDESGDFIFKDLKFHAPQAQQSGAITMYSDYRDNQNYTKEFRYYPQTGKYSFYGYYIDDAEVTTTWPEEDGIVKVKINGTQDIMTAKTAPLDKTPEGSDATQQSQTAYSSQDIKEPTTSGDVIWSDMIARAFSAWTSRRGLKPILNFNHKLARLRFFVKAGEAAAATHSYNEESHLWEPKTQTSNGLNKGVFITRLRTEDMTNAIELNLFEGTAAPQSGAPLAPYFLRSMDSEGKPEVLVDANGTEQVNETGCEYLKNPVAPEQFGTQAETGKKKTPVGDIMFLPDENNKEITCTLNLKEAIQTQEIVTGGISTETWEEKKSEDIEFTIKATDIEKDSNNAGLTEFKAGEQYDITIVVYGYQKIEVHAALSKWVDGGSHEYNPSDDFE